ncbi:hypothetical protein AMTRI_Chr04g183370 [Amborella trichopoda]
MACIYIPVQNSEEEVRVALDQLPRDATDIVDVLKPEQAPLDLWLIIARECFKQGKLEQFRQILEEGVTYERIAVLNAFGASNAFKIVLDGQPDNISALLGQALYKRALQGNPNYPDAVRLGLGLCRYKLGQFDKARQAFQRVLQFDPKNVEALRVMDLQTNEAIAIYWGMEKLQRAFEIFPYCATALNYLANHFFFTRQHFLVEQVIETALALGDNVMIKPHSYHNLARSYHNKGDYEKPGRYYIASIKESNRPRDFVLPYYGLGQVYASSNFKKVLDVYPENCESLKPVGHIHAQFWQIEKALDTFRKATRIEPRGEEVSIELLNNIGVPHFERGEFELADQTFKEALGEDIWLSFIDGKIYPPSVDARACAMQYKDFSFFQKLEEDDIPLELPWDKVTALFNQARLLEQLHDTEKTCFLYKLILFKFPDYGDAYLQLAAISKSRNNIRMSIELIGNVLKVNEKCPDALSMLGSLEFKGDDWFKAKETFKAAREATDGRDSSATLSLGNWNYFAALYGKVLMQRPGSLFAANGVGVVLDIFTQVQEVATGLQFALAVKMYQNCLRKSFTISLTSKFFCTLHTLIMKLNNGKTTRKLLLEHRIPDDIRLAVAELKNALREFSQLSAATCYHFPGFDEKKIETHAGYCKHLLNAAKVHCEAEKREEQPIRQKLEVARQLVLAKKSQMERRKQEDELKQVMRQEEQFERVKELWRREENDANMLNEKVEDGENAQDALNAAGLENFDDQEEMMQSASASKPSRRKQIWSESEDDEPIERPAAIEQPQSDQESDKEIPSHGNGAHGLDDEEED